MIERFPYLIFLTLVTLSYFSAFDLRSEVKHALGHRKNLFKTQNRLSDLLPLENFMDGSFLSQFLNDTRPPECPECPSCFNCIGGSDHCENFSQCDDKSGKCIGCNYGFAGQVGNQNN